MIKKSKSGRLQRCFPINAMSMKKEKDIKRFLGMKSLTQFYSNLE